MNVEIINKSLKFDIFGFSGIAVNNDYTGPAFKLMDKRWKVVKSNDFKHKGLNIWVYELDDKVVAGVELDEGYNIDSILEQKSIMLTKYAHYKHIGPYNLIKQAGQN